MDDGTGSPPPRREALDPSNEASAEPSHESREAPTEHPRSRWWRQRRPPPVSTHPRPPTLVVPDPYLQSRDDGTGSPPPRREALDPNNEGSAEPSRESREAPTEHPRSRRRRRRELLRRGQPSPGAAVLEFQDPMTGLRFPTESALLQFMSDRRLLGSGTSHSGVEGRTHVRQSVLYSDRPRHSRLRRQAQAQEYATSFSSIELHSPVMNLPTSEALPSSNSPHSIPETSEEINDKNVSSSELGRAIKDLPPFERLSLSDNTLFSPQPAEEIDDYYDELGGDVGRRIRDPVPTRGLTRSMLDSLGDSIFTTLPDMDQPRPESDVDSEEYLREVEEYLDSFRHGTLSETFDRLVEIEHATLTALAAEWGTEPPPPPQLRRDKKAQSVQVAERAPSVAAHTGHGVVPTESRPEASMDEIIRNGKTWMNKEVMLCFEKHVKRSAYLMGLEDCLDELLHQCFNVESYNKVYHHYNFTVKMKMPSSDDWVVELYFAEVKEMFGTKYYFCCPLEPDEDGCCYACRSQGVEDLKHPAIGVFSQGSVDAPGFGLWYEDD